MGKVLSAAAKLIEANKRKYLTNKKTIINGHFGITILNEVLQQLQDRIDYTGTVAVDQEGMIMREAVGDVIELAYSDFATFIKNWEVTMYYCDDITKSNIYVLYFSEIGGQRQYHFRFTGLRSGKEA